MQFNELISPERSAFHVAASSKKRALQELSSKLADPDHGLSEDEVFLGLLEREKLGSTGVGLGVAIPHGRIKGNREARAAFISLATPVDFDSIDNQPVDLIIGLLVPEHYTDEHLAVLASLAEIFSDTAFCQRLRAAASDKECFALLSQQTNA
ncbi:MAG: PTS IIA-like nitrogen regulatory protein PtsN [Gammaproteobacteria bacterium]|nr:PTS IIA-like nitrogen regulatory protein PtsN [Gammaproteobacteria bacterium]